MSIHLVLLAGGSGTRLWPLSRQSYPKQFSSLMGAESLFQASARRLSGSGFGAPLVVTGDPFRFIVAELLDAIGITPEAVLIEPSARNTLSAVAAAARVLAAQNSGALMPVAPSDHVMPDTAAFRAAVTAAAPRAEAGDIVTFGITPDRAETGYGYLQLADGSDAAADTPQPLARFVEKPEPAPAAAMLVEGGYL